MTLAIWVSYGILFYVSFVGARGVDLEEVESRLEYILSKVNNGRMALGET